MGFSDLPNFNQALDTVVDFKCQQCGRLNPIQGRADMLERITHTYCLACNAPAVRHRNLNLFELARIKHFVTKGLK